MHDAWSSLIYSLQLRNSAEEDIVTRTEQHIITPTGLLSCLHEPQNMPDDRFYRLMASVCHVWVIGLGADT